MDVTGVLELEELTSNVYFIPEQRSDRQVEPLDFAWLPNLHRHADHVCGDHFFRSPAAAVAFEGYYAALIPDLDLMRRHRGDTPYALDLRIIETEVEAPRLTYGVCPWTVDGHVYTAHRPGMTHVARRQRICFGFDLLFGAETDYRRVPGIVGEFLWQRYGRRCLPDPRPQVLPFAEYGRRYTYVHEMPAVLEEVTIDGERCAGLNNVDRRGANFHAWENDLHVAFGIRHYGRKWGREDLVVAAASRAAVSRVTIGCMNPCCHRPTRCHKYDHMDVAGLIRDARMACIQVPVTGSTMAGHGLLISS